MKNLLNIFNFFLIILIFLFLFIVGLFWFFGRDLPDFKKMSNYEPPIVSRVFASDGNFLEEYSRENRVFSNFDQFPEQLISCFLVAEDKNFYNHIGFDTKGIIRAAFKNVINTFNKKRPEGASTITQQVAKNFLLSGEISYSRKIKEIILSLRIENVFSKKEILELYLNEIYLGNRSYGVSAASVNYFNKSLDELLLEEMALLAALPKAPSSYNPFTNPNKAKERRNWVLQRLFDEGFITKDRFNKAKKSELKLNKKKKIFTEKASFFKEAVRREIIKRYDEKKLYDQGLSILSTLDSKLQIIAENSFHDGLKKFDTRKIWRGPIGKIKNIEKWKEELKNYKKPNGLYHDSLVVVLNVLKEKVVVGYADNSKFELKRQNLKILKKYDEINLNEKFSKGDLIIIDKNNNLSQIPDVNGGLIVIENNSGRILAMVGGYDSSSSFNRVTQAYRQPGSAFKPIVYLSALENKFTPISKILDAPVVIENPHNLKKWRPKNYGNKFYGLSPLRIGIEKSRNLMTVRLAKLVGLEKIEELSTSLGIYKDFPLLMASALGSVETNLLQMSVAYSIIANGGFYITPSLIDKVQDRYGNILYRKDKRDCEDCSLDYQVYSDEDLYNYEKIPEIKENRKRILSSESAYQMTSFLMGVIQRGTAKNINFLDFEVAGKTGTTNNNQDAWFIGYNSEITVGIYVGYDKPKTLGSNETGSRVAAPIFGNFMKNVYKKRKPLPFNVPNKIKFINIDPKTSTPSDSNYIQEAFKESFSFQDNIIDKFIDENDSELRGFY